jgi:hypothetical protein
MLTLGTTMLAAAPLQLFKLVVLLLLSLPRMDMLAHFLEIEGDTIANARHSYRHLSIPLAVKGHLFSTTHPTSPPKEKTRPHKAAVAQTDSSATCY